MKLLSTGLMEWRHKSDTFCSDQSLRPWLHSHSLLIHIGFSAGFTEHQQLSLPPQSRTSEKFSECSSQQHVLYSTINSTKYSSSITSNLTSSFCFPWVSCFSFKIHIARRPHMEMISPCYTWFCVNIMIHFIHCFSSPKSHHVLFSSLDQKYITISFSHWKTYCHFFFHGNQSLIIVH